jgi:hypothetical protein
VFRFAETQLVDFVPPKEYFLIMRNTPDRHRFLCVVLFLPFLTMNSPAVEAQDLPVRSDTSGVGKEGGRPGEYMRLFDGVQQGLASGKVRLISQHLGGQVYMQLRGGETGYFGAGQAYYLLENYLKSHRFANVRFSTVGGSGAMPYATGSAVYNFKGSREYAQVYVALSFTGDRWVITRLNIY